MVDASSAESSFDEEFDPFAGRDPIRLATTPAQLEMWLSSQASPDANCAYNESVQIRLTGVVDEPAMMRALQLLPDFHEALRGHFDQSGEGFVLEPTISVPITRHDLSELSREQREDRLCTLVRHAAETPFDLERGPLLRADLVRLGADEWVVQIGAHHGVCDGWSFDVVVADLGRLYSALTGHVAFPSPPRSSFSNFVALRGSGEVQSRMRRAREFWRSQFENPPASIDLPHDGSRPKTRTYGANHLLRAVDPELTAALRAFSQTQGISLYSVLLSGLTALLYRITNNPEFVIGVPVAGHLDADMEDCVGHLVNLVPLRCRIGRDSTFLQLCRQTATAMLDAREQSCVGFGEILSELGIARDPARVPLISAMFTHVQKYPAGKLRFGNCAVEYKNNPRSFETFELNLTVIESPEGLSLRAHANRDLYSRAWLEHRVEEFMELLRDGCTSPGKSLERLSLLTARAQSWLAQQSCGKALSLDSDSNLFERFRRQVARTPEATAICQGTLRLSYRELEERARQIASLVQGRVQPGALVGICLNRTTDLVASVLGVLAAGTAYVPLDPTFPAARITQMIADSGLELVISESALAGCHGQPKERSVELDRLGQQGAASAERTTPKQVVSNEPAAYVIYTSGSTGQPKGVIVSHRSALNFLMSMQEVPGLSSADRLLAITTLSFDIAVLELLLPLMVGAEIILATREQAADGQQLRELLATSQPTVLQATPASFRLLLEAGWNGSPNLKALCGGEALSSDLAGALLERVRELWNMYGPTETTVWSTCGKVTDPKRITIGKPIANTTIRVLDANFEPCPVGIPGEIYIGGEGIALGYLNRPELTRERFVTDPLIAAHGMRWYRTGDVGKWNANGELECLGRNDLQVKIHGFRIELGEIESVLTSHPAIKQAVVVALKDPTGEARLVAYLVAPHAPDAAVLRFHLQQKLPAYMVPQSFVFLDSFPLTGSGKVDRKSLPTPRQERTERRPPRTEVERVLAQEFESLLGVPRVGLDDDFFALGGHSLLAQRLASRVRARWPIEMPLRVVFNSPTLEALARFVESELGALAPPCSQAIEFEEYTL